MLSRRSLLKGSLAMPVALWAKQLVPFVPQLPPGADRGVASGDPRPDRVVLWTRVPEEAQPTAGDALTVSYEVATSPSFAPGTNVARGDVYTDGSVDYTVKVTVGGLAPATRYYYRFATATGYRSVTGRTQTAPAPDAQPGRIAFAFVSCQNYTQGFYSVYANLALEDVDFCVHLGDNIYERGDIVIDVGQVREDVIGGGEAITLAEYRQKYQLYLSDPNLREVRRRFPWIVLWDDHEVFNNYAGAVVSAQDPQRQRDAYTAFLEYMPVQPIEPLTPSGTPRVRLYRQFSFGDLLDVFVLDERQYRDGAVCKRDLLSLGCPELEEPTRTMLGDPQKIWLESALAASRARWKCLLNEVLMMRLELANLDPRNRRDLPPPMLHAPSQTGQGFFLDLDAWDGYPAERAELLRFIASQRIRNVVVCTGDLHNCYAGVLRPDFSDPSSPPVAVEIVGASVSSAGAAELLGRDVTPLARRIVPRVNPHIEYLELKHHVYTKVVVTPEQLDARYIAVSTVAHPSSGAFLLQGFTVHDGVPELFRHKSGVDG